MKITEPMSGVVPACGDFSLEISALPSDKILMTATNSETGEVLAVRCLFGQAYYRVRVHFLERMLPNSEPNSAIEQNAIIIQQIPTLPVRFTFTCGDQTFTSSLFKFYRACSLRPKDAVSCPVEIIYAGQPFYWALKRSGLAVEGVVSLHHGELERFSQRVSLPDSPFFVVVNPDKLPENLRLNYFETAELRLSVNGEKPLSLRFQLAPNPAGVPILRYVNEYGEPNSLFLCNKIQYNKVKNDLRKCRSVRVHTLPESQQSACVFDRLLTGTSARLDDGRSSLSVTLAEVVAVDDPAGCVTAHVQLFKDQSDEI